MLLTNDVRDDGFGAQYQSIMWTILFAEVNGHTFYYCPIARMNSDISDTKVFIQNAETLMNIKDNYPYLYGVYSLPHHTVYALKAPLFFKEFERDIDKYFASDSFQKVKSLFYQGKRSPYDDIHTHVAIHIRKEAVFDTTLEQERCVDNSYFLHTMKSITHMYANLEKPLLFHIYSIGNEDDFSCFTEYPLQFHLHDTTFDSFNGLVFADILVTSPSSFSYTAAFLTNGTVICKPFWHPPLTHWVVT